MNELENEEKIIDAQSFDVVKCVDVQEIMNREERAGFCICSYGGDN